MNTQTNRTIFYIFFGILSIVFADQITKYILINYFKNNLTPDIIEVYFFLDFIPMWNDGIGFGILQKYKHSNLFFLLLNTLIIFYFAFILVRQGIDNIYSKLSFIFIIGGGLGNNIDRLLRGAVFDFIWFHHKNFYFPVFNVADMSISLGSVFLLMFFIKKDNKQSNKNVENKI